MRLEIQVLGSVGARDASGETIDLGPRLRRLLAVLAASAGDVVTVDRLVDIVWSGEPPEAAERTLRTYVTRLRKSLGAESAGDVIVHREPGYALEVGSDDLDTRRFESELDEAARRLRLAEAGEASSLLESALGRWRGPAFAGFEDEDWCRPEAVRLESRRSEAMALHIEALMAVGEAARAVTGAEALVGRESLAEEPRSLLMRALYAAGRQPEAMRVLPEFRTLLAEELGLEPSSELVELEARIARREVSESADTRLRSYEIGERIGEGAFATVHRGRQPGVDREVAVKIIRAELADQPDFIRRFETEAKTVARLEHPHIVPIIDFWREPGAAYLVFRLMRGGSVESALRARGPYSREALIALLSEVGPALETAHRAGVVHRDVKPANLLLDDQGHAYLSDFGIAARVESTDDISIASPAYASPELLRGEPVGVAADVLSLGVTAFELLTGRLPFADSTSRAELITRQLDAPVPAVSAARPDLGGAVDAVISRATAKRPEDRHATVSALVEDLTAALTDRASGGARVGSGPAQRPSPVPARDRPNPFVGLHAFDEPDADRFFGRAAVVDEVVQRLGHGRFVVVVGPSGSGKSSVVRAGVVPALRDGAVTGSADWFVTTMMPGRDPFESLEAALLRVAVNPPSSLRDQLAEPGGLHRAIRRILPSDDAECLVVVDQLEELFTQSDRATADRFFDELSAALERVECPVRVLATLRADHYDAPLRHRAVARLLPSGTVTVPPMSAAELEQAIVAPAAAAGVEVEPALVAELVASSADRAAALPLLQFSLTEGFDRARAGVMTLSTHRQMGGLAGAIAARADRIVEDSSSEPAARRLFGRLVTLGEGGEDTRRRAGRAELGDDPVTTELIDALGAARLLTFDRDPASREPTVEVAHEALLRDWPRLRSWLDDDRADLRTLGQVSAAATAWEGSGSDPGDLGRGLRLEAAVDLAARRPEMLNPLEIRWVEASTEVRDQELRAASEAAARDRRQNRRLRAALAGAAVLLAAAVVATIMAVVQRGDAIDNQAAAEEARFAAETARADVEVERLVAQSVAETTRAPDLALLLALEANRRRDDVTTRGAIQAVLADEPRLTRVFDELIPGAVTVFNADGGTALAVTLNQDSSSLVVYDPVTGEPLTERQDLAFGLIDANLSWDGSRVATSSVDGVVRVVDVDGLTAVGPDLVLAEPARWLALDRSGDRILTQSVSGRVEVHDTASGELVSRYEPDRDVGARVVEVTRPVLSRDGSKGAVAITSPIAGGSGGVATFDAMTGETIQNVLEHPTPPTSIGLAADGDQTLITGDEQGLAIVYIGAFDVPELDSTVDAAGNASVVESTYQTVELRGHGEAISAVAVSGRFDRVVTASTDGSVRAWTFNVGSGDLIAAAASGPPVEMGTVVDAVSVVAPSQAAASSLGAGWRLFSSVDSSLLDLSHAAPLSRLDGGELHVQPAPLTEPTTLRFRSLEDNADLWRVDTPDGTPFVGGQSSPDGGWIQLWTGTSVETGFSYIIEVGGDEVREFPDGEIREMLLPGVDDAVTVLRPGWDAERVFVSVGTAGGDEIHAVWVDSRTGSIAHGPIVLETGGPALVLSDDRVVYGGGRARLTVLSADLASVLVVEEAPDLTPLVEDPVTGRVAVGGENGAIGLLDPDSGRVRLLEATVGELRAAAFSPEGDLLAVGSTEPGGVQLYDLATGRRIGAPMRSPDDEKAERPQSDTMVWDTGGDGVWWVSASGPERFVTDPVRWSEIACEVAGRELTEEEWRTFVSETEPRVDLCAS